MPPDPSQGTPRLGVRRVVVGLYENNVFAIVSGDEALIVDGADEPGRILALVEGLKVAGIVETHNHADHVQALPALVEALGVSVYAHPDDPPGVPFTPLGDGDHLTVGDVEISVIHTPGHTPGSVCFSVGGYLFSGDTLFPGGPGKTAGPQRFAQIMQSLDRLFERFPDETQVCPGHGLDTTIGRERPHVETWRTRGW